MSVSNAQRTKLTERFGVLVEVDREARLIWITDQRTDKRQTLSVVAPRCKEKVIEVESLSFSDAKGSWDVYLDGQYRFGITR